MRKNVLVTGAAGFVGSYVATELIKRNYAVLGVDSLTNFYSTNLKKMRLGRLQTLEGFKFLELDVSSPALVSKLFENFRFDGVIHLAAQAGVRLPLESSHHYLNSNIVGFHNVLENTIGSGVPIFLYASSSSVYGDDSPTPYSEAYKGLRPKSFYGVTKLANELEASVYG